MTNPHILIIGGGHASLAVVAAAERLHDAGARLTLISEHPSLFYSGMTPEMTGGVYDPSEVQIDFRQLAASRAIEWQQGYVAGIEDDGYTVFTASGRRYTGDLTLFNIGSVTKGAEDAGSVVPSKPLHHIQRLLFLADEAEAGKPARLVVAGGGAAGVEVALNMGARCPRLSITIVEPRERILTEFPASMGRQAQKTLRSRGVEILLGTRAVRADDGAVYLEDGSALPADEVLWATGPAAPGLFSEAWLQVDEQGFLRVERTLQVAGHPHMFAAGDCASVSGYPKLGKIGVHAVKQGPLLVANLEAAVRALKQGQPLADVRMKSFRPYPVAPLILSTGKREGWIATPNTWLRGSSFLRIKHLVDLNWMARYRPMPRFSTLPKRWHIGAAAFR